MQSKLKHKHGFTVIELLAVIVIIAILASVTVVAYQGAQNRAKNAAVTSAANQWEKILKLYKTKTGKYPSYGPSCLGSDVSNFPAATNYADKSCQILGSYTLLYSTIVMDTLKSTLSSSVSLPSGVVPEISGTTGLGAYTNARARGIFYETATPGVSGYLRYYLAGKAANCSPGYQYLSSGGGDTITVCRIDLK